MTDEPTPTTETAAPPTPAPTPAPEPTPDAAPAEEDLSDPGPGVVMTEAPAPKIPIVDQTNAEIEAGRRKVQEHESREAMIAAKRAQEKDEGESVADATKSNADLS